jgi:hypothetical protein
MEPARWKDRRWVSQRHVLATAIVAIMGINLFSVCIPAVRNGTLDPSQAGAPAKSEGGVKLAGV